MKTEYREVGGSITVFMTFIFLLLFALTGGVLDSARFFSSSGYMKVSAYGAYVAVYGHYNRELFHEYGLFGYGGFDGVGEFDWLEEFAQALQTNLAERPVQEENRIPLKKYGSVYRLGAISVRLEDVGYLTQEDRFLAQMEACLKTTVWNDITQGLLKRIQGTDQGNQQSLLDSLDKTSQMEKKREDQQKNSSISEREGEKEIVNEEGNDSARVENPVQFLRKLMRDGVLALVCNEEGLAENEVYPREAGQKTMGTSENDEETTWTDSPRGETDNGGAWDQKKSGTAILKGLLRQSDNLWDKEMFQDQKRKGKLLLYLTKMFSSFVDKKERGIPYGLEYVVTGKQNQKDAVAAVVNRLFLIRTLLNYVYVGQNPVLQEKSLVTSTAIAAPLSAEALIPLLQQSILLMLSLEEACVDITALLEGKKVPVLKDQGNFKMKYEEMCLAGRSLFQQKAAAYPEAGKGALLQDFSGGISYVHYLWLLLLMNSWDTLYRRSLDVIQSDLREKYNQSFELDRCICQTRVSVRYGMPFLATVFLVKKPENAVNRERMARGQVMRRVSVSYGYQ